MNRYIKKSLRSDVRKRANSCCEYCLFPEEYDAFIFEIDHIISLKHGGDSSSENLALSCFYCNNYKGSDIATIIAEKDLLVPFFNPRKGIWKEHFYLVGAEIIPLTDIGKGILRILKMNTKERLEERQGLIELELYPKTNQT